MDRFNKNNLQRFTYLKISELYKDRKYESVIKFSSDFLIDTPNHIVVRFMRAKSYRQLGYFEKAIEDLKYILNINQSDYAIVELFFIYYHLNKYEEALKLVPILYERGSINPNSVSMAEFIMKKELGIPVKVKNEVKWDYIKSQILNYSFDLALHHIQEHLNNPNKKSKFNEYVDLDYLLNVVSSSIDNSKKINVNEMLEMHCFAVSNIGYFNNDICNYIKVIVVPNTNNVITMYPTNEIFSNNVINLEYDHNLLFKKEKSKVKSLSQIDKFNKRYSK